jgi:hypothetical protein
MSERAPSYPMSDCCQTALIRPAIRQRVFWPVGAAAQFQSETIGEYAMYFEPLATVTTVEPVSTLRSWKAHLALAVLDGDYTILDPYCRRLPE